MVTTSDDKKVLVWEWDIGVPVKYIAEPDMHSMPTTTIHPEGKYFVGQSLDNELVALFLRSLGESEYFDGVDLGAAKLGETKGLKLVRFDIDAKLVNPALKQPPAKPAKG